MSAERVWEVLIPQVSTLQDTIYTAASIAAYNPEVYPLIFASDDETKRKIESFVDDMVEEDDSMARITVRVYRDN